MIQYYFGAWYLVSYWAMMSKYENPCAGLQQMVQTNNLTIYQISIKTNDDQEQSIYSKICWSLLFNETCTKIIHAENIWKILYWPYYRKIYQVWLSNGFALSHFLKSLSYASITMEQLGTHVQKLLGLIFLLLIACSPVARSRKGLYFRS